MERFETPILLLIFNRPDLTKIIFNRIKGIKPTHLFIAADGPREGNEDDKIKCKETKEKVLENIDWDCEVRTLFRSENLGCAIAVSNAINWFFEHVEEGIILEDDCLASHSFFNFCQVLLKYYRNERDVMMVSGNNFQFGKWRGDGSYYFSYQTHIWGWATWKERWKLFNFNVEDHRNSFIKNLPIVVSKKNEQRKWLNIFNKLKHNEIDSWAYRWQISVWANLGKVILPNINLVKNIGFGENSTHTKNGNDPVAKMRIGNMSNIIHPSKKIVNRNADAYTLKYLFYKRNSLKNILKYYIKNIANDIF